MHPLFQRDVLSLFVVQIFGLLTLVLFGTYFGIVLDQLSASALILGLVFASRNLVQIFLRVPLSELSQTIGRKPMIITGTLFYAISHGILYLATHWIHVFIATLFVGVGMSMHWPAIFSYIGDISGKEYGKINGIIFQGQDIGILVGSFYAAYLLNKNIIELGDLFLITFIIGIYGFIVSVFILREVLEDENRIVVDSKLKAGWRSFINTISSLKRLTKRPTLRLLFLFELLLTFTEYFFGSFFPLLMVISFGFRNGDVAQIIFLSTVSTIILKPYFGVIFDKWGFKSPILAALAICSIMFYLITLTEKIDESIQFSYLLILYTIATSVIYVGYIASTGATSNNVMPGERGLAMGVLGVYISSGRALSSVALAPVLSIFENTTGSRAEALIELFRFVSLLLLVCVILMVFYVRSQSQKANQVTSQKLEST